MYVTLCKRSHKNAKKNILATQPKKSWAWCDPTQPTHPWVNPINVHLCDYSLGHSLCAPFLQCLGQLSLLRVGGCLALLYIHQIKRMNSHNDLIHDDSTRSWLLLLLQLCVLYTAIYQSRRQFQWQRWSLLRCVWTMHFCCCVISPPWLLSLHQLMHHPNQGFYMSAFEDCISFGEFCDCKTLTPAMPGKSQIWYQCQIPNLLYK